MPPLYPHLPFPPLSRRPCRRRRFVLSSSFLHQVEDHTDATAHPLIPFPPLQKLWGALTHLLHCNSCGLQSAYCGKYAGNLHRAPARFLMGLAQRLCNIDALTAIGFARDSPPTPRRIRIGDTTNATTASKIAHGLVGVMKLTANLLTSNTKLTMWSPT